MSIRIQRLKKATIATLVGIAVISMGANSTSVSAVPQSTNSRGLTETIDTILADPRLEGSSVGVLVRSAQTGETLYTKNPSTLLTPASNTKLYSSSAAIHALGLDYKFTTSVVSSGKLENGVLKGDLYLKGTGDPTMQATDYEKLAAELAAKGIRTVKGKLIADDTHFDNRRLGYGWEWDSSPYYFQPEISALTVAANSNFDISALTVQVSPGSVGKPANVTTAPITNFVTIQNNTTTGASGSVNTINVERQMGNNTIVVTGTIPVDSAVQTAISTVSDPTGFAASLFQDALKKHGIKLKNTEIGRGIVPRGATIFANRQSVPLESILTQFMKLSNNGIAEILVKLMGKKNAPQGTWDNGLPVALDTLRGFGIDTSKLRFVDGSGLSTYNMTSAQRTTDLLIALQSQPWFPTWYNSLPIAGVSDPLVGGTLRARMHNTPAANNLRAKTGTLDSVSAMSGYVVSADGERLVFSIMEEHFLSSSPKPLEDAIGVALASFSRQTGVRDQQEVKTQQQRIYTTFENAHID